MQNFQDTFETRERSFMSAFSICMTVPLMLLKQKIPVRSSHPDVFYEKERFEKFDQVEKN